MTEEAYIRKHITRFDQFCFWSPALTFIPMAFAVYYAIVDNGAMYLVSAAGVILTITITAILHLVVFHHRVKKLRRDWFWKNKRI